MSEIPSPCISACQMDMGNNFYTGCLRTREEIEGWRMASDEVKREILDRVASRRAEGKT